jgi:hypothetical protein
MTSAGKDEFVVWEAGFTITIMPITTRKPRIPENTIVKIWRRVMFNIAYDSAVRG